MLLYEYMELAETRVMVSQVADVCLESLLRVKEIVVARGKLTEDTPERARTIHMLLKVLDQLAVSRHVHPMLQEFLLTVCVERTEFWRFIKHYAGQILLNDKVCSPSRRLVSSFCLRSSFSGIYSLLLCFPSLVKGTGQVSRYERERMWRLSV